jgi:D-alanine transaminase
VPNIAFLNGRFMPLSRAKIHVEDRGYLFGDGIYELIRTYNGKIFLLDEHLSRMERSAKALNLDGCFTRQEWKKIITDAHEKSRYRNAKIYVQITRGVAPRSHEIPPNIRPTTLVTVRRFLPHPEHLQKRGVAIMATEDYRWGRCDLKSINLLPNILAKQKARASGAFEAVFIRNGWVTEGSTSNFFAVINGSLVTPPEGPFLLSGVTRDLVLKLARQIGLDAKERDISIDEIYQSEEAFITATSLEVMPVVKVNGHAIGNGRPGIHTQRLYKLLENLTEKK